MARALVLARRGLGTTSPNPMVGAIVLDAAGRFAGAGFHARAGAPHAEVHALRAAGERARGGTLYVTLEPCCTQGRTPPCTRAVVAAGVRRVVAAMRDPNPAVDGAGLEALRAAGIEVTAGVDEARARRLNRAFEKNVRGGRPFVLAKVAMSLDRKIGTRDTRVRISDPMMERTTMKLRAGADAILVGVGTVVADDPRLTNRDPHWSAQPVRVILDPDLRTPRGARLFAETTPLWLVHRADADTHGKTFGAHAERVPITREGGGRLDPRVVLDVLWQRGIRSVLIEGGPATLGEFHARGLVDEWVLYVHDTPLGETLEGRNTLEFELNPPLHLSVQSVIKRAHDWEVVGTPCSPGSLKPPLRSTP